MTIREFSKYVVFACMMLILCGCSKPILIGTDAAVYSRGSLYAVAGQDLDSVYKATLAAMKQLEIEIAEQNKDVFYAKVIGKIADGRTVTIRLEPGADKSTELEIQTSTFGNEERSRVIYKKIQENLKTVSK
ncbi:MAG: DUF3568 domain-containing protein [Phycisphaerae bacterium]|nr:DUF3568 domain-containing protein [Phycisphaerae bacterium]